MQHLYFPLVHKLSVCEWERDTKNEFWPLATVTLAQCFSHFCVHMNH